MNQIIEGHQKLVEALIKALKGKGYEILNADNKDYPSLEKLGRHQPDIVAKTPEGLIIIGEAKTSNDIISERAKEQYWDFSARQMAEGPLKGQNVEFHIIVDYKKDLESLKKVLYELGLNIKIGKNIFLWYFKE